jgi:hypothetical protein
MNEFLQHCRNMVTRGMDRELFLQEREIVVRHFELNFALFKMWLMHYSECLGSGRA